MPTSDNNCQNCGCTPNPLDSANWTSESTVAGAGIKPAKGSASGSGSGSGCSLKFIKNEVVFPWTTGTYDALSNLDSNCEYNDITWGISGKSSGATMKGSVVTFGKDGAIITIKATCKGVTSSMTLIYIKLQIHLEKKDVTRQRVDVDVGNEINLSAVVTPASLAPKDGAYAWVIPDIVLENFEPQKVSDPVTKLPDADKLKIGLLFHWVDGGEKDVSVATKVKGLSLLAQTKFIVDRPSVTFVFDPVRSFDPLVAWPIAGQPETAWRVSRQITYSVNSAARVKGKLGWCQTVTGLFLLRSGDDGKDLYRYPSVPNPKLALDGGYLYGPYPPDFVDTPGVGSPIQLTKNAEYSGSFMLYMMYLHKKPGSRWVPLASAVWGVKMSVSRLGPPAAKPHYAFENAPEFPAAPDSKDETGTPNWKWIAKPPKAKKGT